MKKKAPRRAKKVLKPAKTTDVRLISKKICIRKTHDEESPGSVRSVSIAELLAKLNHYSVKVQEHTLCRLDASLRSDSPAASQMLTVFQAVSFKLLSENQTIREKSHAILCHIVEAGGLDLRTIDQATLPILRAAMTHTDAAIRVDTLPFLGNYLSVYGARQSSLKYSTSGNTAENERLLLLLSVLDGLDVDFLSTAKLDRVRWALVSVSLLFDILSHDEEIDGIVQRRPLLFLKFFQGLVRFLGVPSTLQGIVAYKEPTQDGDSTADLRFSSVVLRCFAHCVPILSHLLNSKRITAKKVVPLVDSLLDVLKGFFESCPHPSTRVNITILVQLMTDEFNGRYASEFDSFTEDVVTPWVIKAFCREKNPRTAQKLSYVLWRRAHSKNPPNDLAALFAKLFPVTNKPSRPIGIHDFIRRSVRTAGESEDFTFFSNGILELYRERIEMILCRGDHKAEFFGWEFELFSDLPYVLWKLMRNRSRLPGYVRCDGDEHIIVNICTIVWHLVRAFSGRGGDSLDPTGFPFQQHVCRMAQGCLLLHKQTRSPFDGDEKIKTFLQRVLPYCGSLVSHGEHG